MTERTYSIGNINEKAQNHQKPSIDTTHRQRQLSLHISEKKVEGDPENTQGYGDYKVLMGREGSFQWGTLGL